MKRSRLALFIAIAGLACSGSSFAGTIGLPATPSLQSGGGSKPQYSSPYYAQHVEYAKYLYGDDWVKHVVDIMKAWDENMASNDPTKLKSVLSFNNFFSFVTAADWHMRVGYVALQGYLKTAEGYNEAMEKDAQTVNGKVDTSLAYQFKEDASMMVYQAWPMAGVVADAQERLLRAATIYQVSLNKVTSLPDGDPFDDLKTKFINTVVDKVRSLANKFLPIATVDLVDDEEDEIDLALFEGNLALLLTNSSFYYTKDDGKIGYVSFVNFGDNFAFNRWPAGFGGDGAIDTASVEYLDF